MRRITSLLVIFLLSASFVSATSPADRVYRGKIKHLGYDVRDNRVRVDVETERPGDTGGRGQLYFENEASKALADMIHQAFIHDIRVEVWVNITDARGRPNVIYTVNFHKTP